MWPQTFLAVDEMSSVVLV